MLRHKEPIFSPSTGRWPPETGPVAQRHRQQTIPGPGHQHQHQPAGGWPELSRRANREGAAGLPQTAGLGAAWLAQRGCPAVPVCTPAASTRERSPRAVGTGLGWPLAAASALGTDGDGFPWRHSCVTSTQSPVTNPACPQHSAPAAPPRDAPGSRLPSRPAAPSQLSASARLPVQGCSVPGASCGRGYPQHPPPSAPKEGRGLTLVLQTHLTAAGRISDLTPWSHAAAKLQAGSPSWGHRPPGPCPTAPPSQGVPPLRASPLSECPPTRGSCADPRGCGSPCARCPRGGFGGTGCSGGRQPEERVCASPRQLSPDPPASFAPAGGWVRW